MSAMWGARTRRTSVSAMIAPRERSSPAALRRSASSSRALCTATPSLTGKSAPSQVMVSGAGRSVVCRSASARRRRSATEPGSNRHARSSTTPTSSRSPIASNRRRVPGDGLVDEHPVLQRQAGRLPREQGHLPLTDAAGPERLVGAGQLGGQHFREPDVALPAVRGLPARERDLLGSNAAVASVCAPSAAHLSSSSARIRSMSSASSSLLAPASSRRVQDATSPAEGSATSVAPPPASSPRSLMAHTLGATTDSPSPASTGPPPGISARPPCPIGAAQGQLCSTNPSECPAGQQHDCRGT